MTNRALQQLICNPPDMEACLAALLMQIPIGRVTTHGDLRNLVNRTSPTIRQRKFLIRLGLLFDLGDALVANPLRPTLDPLAGDLYFGECFEVSRCLDERCQLHSRVRHLLQHRRRERAIGLNADHAGQRGKKPCGSKGSSILARRPRPAHDGQSGPADAVPYIGPACHI